ncbi:transposase family protein [Lachnospiraceae bacterium 54-11]
MQGLLDYVSTVTDIRQEKKVQYKMMDIIMPVFFATLANADDWVEMEVLPMVPSEFPENFQKKCLS